MSTEGVRLTHWEGEPVGVWASLWGVPEVEAWEAVGSTNDRARERAREGAPPFTVVLAEEQTAGRGREGRHWSSPPGAGLWMSVVLRSGPAAARRLAPILAGLAVCRAAEAVASVSAGLKWPNDVLVDGRKTCGILCEGAGDVVVAGIGVNVRQRRDDFPDELRDRATSLELASGGTVSRGALAGGIVRELRGLVGRPVLRLDGRVGEEVRSRDVLRGRSVRIEGGPRGVARGITPDGALEVEEAGGAVERVVAGSVRVVDAE